LIFTGEGSTQLKKSKISQLAQKRKRKILNLCSFLRQGPQEPDFRGGGFGPYSGEGTLVLNFWPQ
jgi:hypothetical protein